MQVMISSDCMKIAHYCLEDKSSLQLQKDSIAIDSIHLD